MQPHIHAYMHKYIVVTIHICAKKHHSHTFLNTHTKREGERKTLGV